MNRAVVSALLIALIFAGCLLALNVMTKSTDTLCVMIENVIDAGENGTPDQTEAAIDELEDYWHEHYIRMSYIVPTNVLNDISYALAKLRPLYRSGADDFVAECRGIRYWAVLLREGQTPKLHAVF